MKKKHKLQKFNAFDVFNYLLMACLTVICFYPLWTILVASFSDGNDYIKGGVYFWPRVFSVNNYSMAFKDAALVKSIGISFARVVVGTTCTLIFTSMTAYGLSLKDVKFRSAIYNVNLFTMFFGGGLIPYFILIKTLGLINSFWVYIIPALYSVYDMIIISNFFRDLPAELHESAVLDGASEFRIYISIYMPLSKAVLATVGLWIAVGQWNAYFDSMMYTTKEDLQTLQLFLVKLIKQADAMKAGNDLYMTERDMEIGTTYLTIRYATMAIATIPVLCIYPFVQKHFTKGIMLGSLKG